MARARTETNGKLEKAMEALAQSHATLAQAQATLVQNQAAFVQTQQSFLAQMADSQRDAAEFRRRTEEWQRHADERFARIEAILLEHSRMLQALPDAVREKIGFSLPDFTARTARLNNSAVCAQRLHVTWLIEKPDPFPLIEKRAQILGRED
jgi:hypothetical protein